MNQLRQHIKFTWRHKYRQWQQRKRLAHLGKRVFIERNVDLMRYPRNIQIDDDVVLKEGARICACNDKATITIGKNTTVGYHAFMFASEKIVIGDDCMIGPFSYIVDSDHGKKRQQTMNRQPNETAAIIINNDVWIGTGVKILKGVTIGEGAVVAAGAVVKDDVPPYKIVGGIPAKVISER